MTMNRPTLRPAALLAVLVTSAAVAQTDPIEEARAAREASARSLDEGDLEKARDELAAALRVLDTIAGADRELEVMVERWHAGELGNRLGVTRSVAELRCAAWRGVVSYYEALPGLEEATAASLQYARAQAAWAFQALGQRDEALALRRRIVRTGRDWPDPNDPNGWAARQELARILAGAGHDDEALRAIRDLIVDTGDTQEERVESESKQWLARTLADFGRLTDALALQREIVAELESRYGPTALPTLTARENVALTLGRLDRFDEAFDELEAIIGIYGAEHPDAVGLAGARQSFATLLCQQNLYWDPRVRGYYQEALARYEAAREAGEPVRVRDVETCRWEFAQAELKHGRYMEAHDLAQQALDAMAGDDELGPDHPDTTWARGILAFVNGYLGDYETALALFRKNLEIRRRALPPGHPDTLIVARLVGVHLRLLASRDDSPELLAEAEELLRASARGFESLPQVPTWELQNAYVALSELLVETGRASEAVEVMRRAVELADATVPEAAAAYERGFLGHALWIAGQDAAAREVFARALPLLRHQLDYRTYAVFARDHAVALLRAGRRDELTDHLRELLGFAREHFDECLGLPPRQSLELTAMIRENAEFALSFADQTSAEDELRADAFGLLESLRGVTLQSANVLARTAGDPEIERLLRQAARARMAVRARVLDPASGVRSAADVVAEARASERAEFQALRKALREEGWELQEVSSRDLGTRLKPDEAAISYRRARRWILDEERPGGVRVEPHFLVHVVLPGGEFAEFDLGVAAEIDDLCGLWYARIDGGLDRGRPRRGKRDDPDTRLFKKIFEPLKEALADAKTLYVCLDGELHRIPFELLAGQERTVLFETSFARLMSEAPSDYEGASLVAVGGVDFNAAAADASGPERGAAARVPEAERGRGGPSWGDLPATGAEADAVVAQFRDHWADGEIVRLHGAGATRREFLEHITGCRFIHVATHGEYVDDELAASDADDFASSPFDIAVRGYAPMTLCYLVFAGANDDAVGDQALVTAEELAGLDLSGCELAVLSACRTSEGEVALGHGVHSLQTALHAAGVRTVIATRWRVPDEAAQRLMERFYEEHWKNGLPKFEALESAKEWVAGQKGADVPIKAWAGFVLTGDPK